MKQELITLSLRSYRYREMAAGERSQITIGLLVTALVIWVMSISMAAGATVHDDETMGVPQEELFSEAELDQMRGGMNIGGLDVSISADLFTRIDGVTVLQSALRLSNTGLVLDNASLARLAGTGTPGVTAVSGGSANALAALPPGVQINGLTNAAGVIVNDKKGTTAALASIGNGQLSNIVINQADNRTVNQQLNVQLTVGNFQRFQGAAQNASALGRMLNTTNLLR